MSNTLWQAICDELCPFEMKVMKCNSPWTVIGDMQYLGELTYAVWYRVEDNSICNTACGGIRWAMFLWRLFEMQFSWAMFLWRLFDMQFSWADIRYAMFLWRLFDMQLCLNLDNALDTPAVAM